MSPAVWLPYMVTNAHLDAAQRVFLTAFDVLQAYPSPLTHRLAVEAMDCLELLMLQFAAERDLVTVDPLPQVPPLRQFLGVA